MPAEVQDVGSMEQTVGGARQGAELRGVLRGLAAPLVLAGLGVAGLLAWSYWQFGSLSMAMAYVSGYALVPESATLDAGDAPAGKDTKVQFRLRNVSGRPVRVVGAKSDCGCVAVDDLPLTVDARQAAEMRLRFSPRPTEVGLLIRHKTVLLLDVDNPTIVLTVTARVVAGDAK